MSEKTHKKTDKELLEMAQAGLQFGHRSSRLHPKMKQFIFKPKGEIYIIDLEKTKEGLKKALDYLKKVKKEEGTVLFVGTKIQHKKLIREAAERYQMPFVVERWLGGLLTNFANMRKRIAGFKELREKINSTNFEKYSKKEQGELKKEFLRMSLKFSGLEKMDSLPTAVFIADIEKDALALDECKRVGVPVVAVVDTNVDPSRVDYPVPANDDAISSLQYILDKIDEVM